MDIAGLLPIRTRIVRMQCLQRVRLGLFPEQALSALLLASDPQHKDQLNSITFDIPRQAKNDWAPGDIFEFVIFAAKPDWTKLERIEALLRGLPGSAPRKGEAHAFGENWRLVGIEALHDNTTLSLADLRAEAMLWSAQRSFRIRLTSPLKIVHKAAGSRTLLTESAFTSEVLNRTLEQSLVNLKFALALSEWTVPTFNLRLDRAELFQVNPLPASAEPKRIKLSRGVLGEFRVSWPEAPTDDQWLSLVLLQYLGIGQARAHGLGRFRLERLDGVASKLEISLTYSALDRAKNDANLSEAYEHVAANRSIRLCCNVETDDNDDLTEAEAWAEAQEQARQEAAKSRCLEQVAADLTSSAMPVAALHPVRIPKADGSMRELMIPPFRDRVAQRALLQVLDPLIDPLFAASSFGFRRGIGRERARDRIQLLKRQGFTVVAETDVRKFFDEVDWWQLEVRLLGLFGQDPVVPRIMQWIQAERTDGLSRRGGLPQGAPLSPLLSNLMLDQLDRVLLDAGVAPVRFADDLVILAKTEADARHALTLAAETLGDAGLALKLEKTRITDFERGFLFLGYRFVKDLVVRADPGHDDAIDLDSALLEQITATPEATETGSTIQAHGEHPGTLLIINERGARLRLAQGQLAVERADGQLSLHPFASLAAILLISRCRLSSEVIKACLRSQVPLVFLNEQGRCFGSTAGMPDAKALARMNAQVAFGQDTERALLAARELVQARIDGMATLLRHRKAPAEALSHLHSLSDSASRAANLAALRGIEGQATRTHFRQIGHMMPFGFSFSERNRRPPKDPVNALLSFSYMLLMQLTEAVLIANQLNPRLGFYHQAHGSHATLASDLLEPYRFVVERQVLAMIHRREVRPEQFEYLATGACLMTAEARRAVTLAVMTRLHQPLRAHAADRALSIAEHLHEQAVAYSAMVSGGPIWTLSRFK
ncbi:CRISPR-associated endonuclease Cas1 [Ahniella affigens]|uniref:CRISPR-associated endonuclease Cas1 n=1 Tax=Ahniella affigens TaxID=2021234 RepID=A0A2P1PTT3_9GAMM|nr:CRISPR-associated endonuclease Cas1 [Ahniella affigens]